MDTFQARRAREIIPSQTQHDVIIGSLLGDGYLVKTTRGYALRCNHGIQQESYLNWKYRVLKSLTNSSPQRYENSIYFRTVSHQLFAKLRTIFYRGNKKIISKLFQQWLTPRALAVWLMDDGSRDKNQIRINTQSFSQKENIMLAKILEATFGIKATLNRDKHLFRLRISQQSMPRLRQFVRKYFVPSMLYKLSP